MLPQVDLEIVASTYHHEYRFLFFENGLIFENTIKLSTSKPGESG